MIAAFLALLFVGVAFVGTAVFMGGIFLAVLALEQWDKRHPPARSEAQR
jgi:heme/copper-type cytochrome/quinol oxidase subunit 3